MDASNTIRQRTASIGTSNFILVHGQDRYKAASARVLLTRARQFSRLENSWRVRSSQPASIELALSSMWARFASCAALTLLLAIPAAAAEFRGWQGLRVIEQDGYPNALRA